MIVIGLDGATWSFIKPNLGKLPAFSELLEKHRHCTLTCDVRPVHSGPSWATIFSGLMPEEHGITHFVMGEDERGRLLERRIFIWDMVPRAIVMGVPISLPPINVNYQMRDWEKRILSTTSEEMMESTRKAADDLLGAIDYGEADLVAAVFSEPDRAQHMFWRKPQALLGHYVSIDRALSRVMGRLGGRDFLILSDHGFTDADETRMMGWDTVRENQSGGHHPDGIAISNMDPPTKVSDVHGFLKKALRI